MIKLQTMATMAFEPSLSTSALRQPHELTSMADTLPSVNFGFEDLRERMARFTTRFDEFIENGRKRVLEERNQFRMNVAELQGKPTLAPDVTPPPTLLTNEQRSSECASATSRSSR